MLVIGDEILSGRTKDQNIGTIADHLTGLGIDLKEVRVVADEEADIVDALNALRARYTYVFTTGGIGPTHDDITADAIAKANPKINPAKLMAGARLAIPAGARLPQNKAPTPLAYDHGLPAPKPAKTNITHSVQQRAAGNAGH